MEFPWLLVHIAVLATLVCGLHALAPRLSRVRSQRPGAPPRESGGLAPLYAVVGLIEAFLFSVGHFDPEPVAALLGTPPQTVANGLFLPVLLGTMVTLYVLSGAGEARRFLLVMLVLYVTHAAIDGAVAFLVERQPTGPADPGQRPLVDIDHRVRVASAAAICVDMLVVVIVYQVFTNWLPRTPQVVLVFVSLVAAMMADGVVWGLGMGYPVAIDDLQVLTKAQAGAAAAIPVATYIAWRKHRGHEGAGDRHALEIFRLRERIAAVERRLARITDAFGRYVAPEVIDDLVASDQPIELGGDERDVTVMFVDMRRYTTLSEQLAPKELIRMLNGYFEVVGEAVMRHGGMINEFEGDGVLAVFGAPAAHADHPDRAVAAGRDILTAIDTLNERWAADGTAARWRACGIARVSVRVGVHSGPAVVGNIGSEHHVKYAVIGDTVNVASRVEELASVLEAQLLVTEATVGRLTRSYPVVDRGSHVLKGRDGPVREYEAGAPAYTAGVAAAATSSIVS